MHLPWFQWGSTEWCWGVPLSGWGNLEISWSLFLPFVNRQLPTTNTAVWAEKKCPLLHFGDLCAIYSACYAVLSSHLGDFGVLLHVLLVKVTQSTDRIHWKAHWVFALCFSPYFGHLKVIFFFRAFLGRSHCFWATPHVFLLLSFLMSSLPMVVSLAVKVCACGILQHLVHSAGRVCVLFFLCCREKEILHSCKSFSVCLL